MNHTWYQEFRAEIIGTLCWEKSLSGKEKIRIFREYVLSNISTILSENPELSEDDFSFLTNVSKEEMLRRNLLAIMEKQNTNTKAKEAFVYENANEIFWSLYKRHNMNNVNCMRNNINHIWTCLKNALEDTKTKNPALFKKSKQNGEEYDFEIDKIKKCLMILSSYYLTLSPPDYFRGFWPLKFFGESDKTYEIIKKQKESWIENKWNMDVYNAIMHHGTPTEKKIASEDHIRKYGIYHDFECHVPYYSEPMRKIRKKVWDYCKEHRIPLTQSITAEILNLAIELLRNDYDLVIGVLNSGSPIAALHEICGKNVRYIEWHRNWTREPIWRHIGIDSSKIKKDTRPKILICEHDSLTWLTLEKIQPLIQSLHPKSVDVCFLNDISQKNRTNTQRLELYDKTINPWDVFQTRFYDNFMYLRKFLKVR